MRLVALYQHLALLASLAMPATPALAAYSQPASTFSSGGGISASAGYENLGVIGQPAIVGSSSSASYTANHGFLHVLGDGYKILYPVIAAAPGTLTFSIMATKSGDQSLGISNTGGSTLAWTVTKNSPDSIFSFTPSTGINAGSVTVTADAASLSPGTYSNTLRVSGTGIEQTAQLQLDLTVTDLMYTLAVTLKLATPEKGGGTVTSTLPDSRLSCQRTGGTSDVMCSALFLPGSSVTLHQTPDSSTTWATWGAPGCGTNQDCQVVMTADQGTDVTFPYSHMAKVVSNSYVSDSLVSAYASAIANAATTDTINARAVTFVEGSPGTDVVFNGGKTINLVGGLDAYYQAIIDGYTTIQPPSTKAFKVGGTGSRLNVKGPVKVKP